MAERRQTRVDCVYPEDHSEVLTDGALGKGARVGEQKRESGESQGVSALRLGGGD
jgi:hypothetical protein